MATKEEQEKILAQMREAQAKQAEVAKKTGRAPLGGEEVEQQSQPKPVEKEQKQSISADERVRQLEEQLKKAKEEKDDLTDQLANKGAYSENKKNQQALSDIVNANDSYHFTKEYEVTTNGNAGPKKTSKIFIKMHAPSIVEQFKIQTEVVDITDDYVGSISAAYQELATAIGYFRVVGDNVPKWFTNIEDTYRVDIIFDVWNDYQEWLSRFLEDRIQ